MSKILFEKRQRYKERERQGVEESKKIFRVTRSRSRFPHPAFPLPSSGRRNMRGARRVKKCEGAKYGSTVKRSEENYKGSRSRSRSRFAKSRKRMRIKIEIEEELCLHIRS